MASRSTPRVVGTIVDWNIERGFGFIAPLDGGAQIFVHIRALPPGTAAPEIGQRVTYEEGLNPEGKRRAVRVTLTKGRSPQPFAPSDSVSYLAIPAFLAIAILVAIFWNPPLWALWLYLGMSAICFAAYGRDKHASIHNGWRIPESSLIIPGLLGGWPGAILGQQIFRHKTKKTAFLWTFWSSVVLNVILFVLLTSPIGQTVIAATMDYWLGS